MSEKEIRTSLKHYTSIENLFKILDTGYLLLGDPEKWEDKNDFAAVRAFCRLKGEELKTEIQIGVLCFAEGEELIHHWNTYAEDGCYIEFDEKEILKEITDPNFFLHGFVKYKSTKDVTSAYLKGLVAGKKTNTFPFLKRSPYECDKEYRVIWFGKGKKPAGIPLKKSAIKRITLSPKIPDAKREKYRKEIKDKFEKQYGKSGIRVDFSRHLKSDEWITKFKQFSKKR